VPGSNRKLTPRSRSLLTVAGWLAATAAATSIGILAVGAIGSGIAGSPARPLSGGEVTKALATSSPVAPAPSGASPSGVSPTGGSPTGEPTGPAGSPGSQPTGASRVFGSKGGTVVARCVAGKAELISWSPAQGYEADDVRRGPAASVGLQFERDDIEIKISVECVGGVPTPHIETETRHGH